MNITRRKLDGLVEYSDFGVYVLSEYTLETDKLIIVEMNNISHEVLSVDIETLPVNFIDRAYSYNAGVWNVVNQEVIDLHLDKRKNKLILKFETGTDNLIKKIVGERAFEYTLAETEAIAFKAAGYPENDVPASVSSDAIANNYSNTIACDLILTMATNWRGVQTALRANRLMSKAQVKNAITEEELNTIESAWNEFLAYIKQQII